ncbi:MAG: signal peptide peptidase SppA [Fibrobacterota bacterium]
MKKRNTLLLITLLILPVLITIIKITLFKNSFDSYGSVSSMGRPAVGIITIEGVIYDSEETLARLDKLEQSPIIKAILLDINSPGGAVAPSQEIYRAAASCSKPVYAVMRSVAASGGYYIASAADRIFASPGTLTGSIGVIMQFPRYDEMMDKLGLGMRTIKAGSLKDAGSPYRRLKQEERRYFEDLITETHDRFVADVARGRSMDTTAVRPLAEGEIFSGEKALENGLIDETSGIQGAKSFIRKEHGLSEKTPFIREEEPDFFERAFQNTQVLGISLSDIEKHTTPKAGIYYLCPSLK